MKKDFVEYPEALTLKELGFDEPCIAWFAETKDLQIAPETYKKWTSKPCNNSNIVKVFNNDCFTAPTFTQCFRWFRDNYNLHHVINKGFEFFGSNVILEENRHNSRQNKIVPYHIPKYFDKHNTYEEAELACLKKLIEIVKQK